MDELENKKENTKEKPLEKNPEDLNKEQEESKAFEPDSPAKEKQIIEDAKKEVQIENSKEETKSLASSQKESSIKEEKNLDGKEPEKKEAPTIVPKNKEGSFKPLIFVMIASMAVAFFWDKIPFIKDAVHFVLDPSAGALLNWNLTVGMLLIVFVISLFTTLVQKYATDQKALKELRKEQKILQDEMKKYKENPAKVAELSKKQFEFLPKTFKLTSRAMMFTGIPFILFFRWFNDFFGAIDPEPVFLGFMTWFWFYLIFVMVFSGFLRKWLKVV